MWHNIKQIAKTHRFNEAAFLEFANANIDRFSLVKDGDLLQVNTRNADALIDQFKRYQDNRDNTILKEMDLAIDRLKNPGKRWTLDDLEQDSDLDS